LVRVLVVVTKSARESAHYSESVRTAYMFAGMQFDVDYVLMDRAAFLLAEAPKAPYRPDALVRMAELENIGVWVLETALKRSGVSAPAWVRVMTGAELAQRLLTSKALVF